MLRIQYRGLGQAPYSAELTDVVRSFPRCFTAEMAAQKLEAAAEFSRKVIVDKAYLTSGVDPGPLAQAGQAARDAASVWRGRMPWFWQTATEYCAGSPEHASVLQLISAIYGESSSAAGQQEVIQKAREDLVEDLKKPPQIIPGLSWGQVVAAAGVVGAGIFLAVLLSRKKTVVEIEEEEMAA